MRCHLSLRLPNNPHLLTKLHPNHSGTRGNSTPTPSLFPIQHSSFAPSAPRHRRTPPSATMAAAATLLLPSHPNPSPNPKFGYLRSLLVSGALKLRPFLRAGRLDDNHDLLSCGGGGGLGTLLMSTTAASTARVSPYLWTLAANPTFVSGLAAVVLAQSVKMLLVSLVERRWDLGMLFSSGGMPSSHSALCTALTAAVAMCHGVGDSLFPVCFGFSMIVMYDAIGVRRHAGMQAEVLNKIVEDLFQGHPISKRKLKELLGHTPSQVTAGALLGILTACFCCQGCVVAI